ncbi:MAG: cytochrome-c oxidase, cbb3-type subunit III [Micavibrio aeruginosavorus]|nr:cytochrome-c oxidase, cbb3-type subunit III [Micavibrio aeruginosavorus]
MSENDKKEIDQVSGIETTGHEWDGLKELNNPLPRWWLWVFYVTIVWSIGYWVVFPAWPVPSGATKGTAEWTQFSRLEKSQQDIAVLQAGYIENFKAAPFDRIMNDEQLYAFATAGGAAAFKDNCATCHGTGGAGGRGYPNLNDDDWIWGGTIEDIHQTLEFGARSGHPETRVSAMPAFGKDGLMSREDIATVVDYVANLPRQGHDLSSKGYDLFQKNCASCHGTEAKGNREFGAPNLTDGIWLYGGSKDTIYKTVYNGRSGVMPYWSGRLDDNTIRQLAVYVHSLGGGEKSEGTENGGSQRKPESPAAR